MLLYHVFPMANRATALLVARDTNTVRVRMSDAHAPTMRAGVRGDQWAVGSAEHLASAGYLVLESPDA